MSVFGRGRGEALVIHLGYGTWATVDSFRDPSTRRPVALEYLSGMGVRPDAIRFVIATHWDQDHISGLAELVRSAQAADVVLSHALRSSDFVRLALRHQQRTYASPLGSGTKEFVSLLDALEDDRVVRLVAQDTVLMDRYDVAFAALSPSPTVSLDALSAPSVAALEVAKTGDSVREPTPNAASIVLAIRAGGPSMLLGGDLERGDDARGGWEAVRRAELARHLQADLFKVPHHGSDDADDPETWASFLADDYNFVLTRFNNGARSLPRDIDRRRLRARSNHGVLIGQERQRQHFHGVVGRQVRSATRDGVWRVTGAIGHYRWRCPIHDATGFDVVCAGAAEPV